MLSILTIVVPVFGLIMLGWTAAKSRYLGDGSGRVLAEFAFKVAMPAFLFKAMATAKPLEGSALSLVAAYFGALGLTWIAATLASRWILRRPAPDAAVVAMGATFGNTVMLGIPLALTAFGPDAAAPMALIIAIETPLMWIAATVQMEIALRREGQQAKSGSLTVLTELLLNPIILSMLLGLAWRMTGLPLPELPDRMLTLAAQAAVPTALFALGMTLANYSIRGELGTATLIGLLKLALYPAFAYVLAVEVFALPKLWASLVILMAAMPVGANAYLFAARYDRVVAAVSGALAASTIIAIASISALLFVLSQAAG